MCPPDLQDMKFLVVARLKGCHYPFFFVWRLGFIASLRVSPCDFKVILNHISKGASFLFRVDLFFPFDLFFPSTAAYLVDF